MTFLNQYIKGSDSQYYYSEQFYEKKDDKEFILAAGSFEGHGLICKIGLDGNPLWEKRYHIEDKEELKVHKIIQITYHSGEITNYIAYLKLNKQRHFLLSFSSVDGEINWAREFFPDLSSEGQVFLEPSKKYHEEYTFYLVTSEGKKHCHSYHPVISKFNGNGSLLQSKRLFFKDRPFMVSAMHTDDYMLVLAGMYPEEKKSLLVGFEPNLNLTWHRIIEDFPCELYDIKIQNPDFYLIAGRNLNSGLLFFSRFIYFKYDITIYEIAESERYAPTLCPNANDFYLVLHADNNGTIHRFNLGCQQIWAKEIIVSSNFENGISFIHQYNNRLTFNGNDNGGEHFIGNTDKELESCKTFDIDLLNLKEKEVKTPNAEIIARESEFGVDKVKPEAKEVESKVVELCYKEQGVAIGFDEKTALQSASLILQSAGSKGDDGSAKGIHLRWLLRGNLGKNHLPKGDYAQTSHNFNKTNDYVKIYRAPYQSVFFTLDFNTPPTTVDDRHKLWIYNISDKLLYVYFLNTDIYAELRHGIDPLADSSGFMQKYNERSGVVEVECKNELFFAAKLVPSNFLSTSELKTETLSVEENTLTATKYLTSRKTYPRSAFSNVLLICENGRSIRYQTNAVVNTIHFEFYSDFLLNTNTKGGWKELGRYALSLDDNQVFNWLEPTNGLVHGKWPRFNENAFVNINNYKKKWNGAITDPDDRNIKMVVSKYISLSNGRDNPRAEDAIAPGENTTISLLDTLNVGSFDFHLARMLGLGSLDVESRVLFGEYIYAAEYFTNKDVENVSLPKTKQHLYLSLPTSISNERLPLPVKIEAIRPGIYAEPNSDGSSGLTDTDGYTFDGRYRFVSLIAEQGMQNNLYEPFYHTSNEFCYKDFSFPIYGGVEYRKNNEPGWVKPELSNDPDYLNAVASGQTAHAETVPLLVQENTNVLYIHKQRDNGVHYYGSYGINLFSRSTSSPVVLNIVTMLEPANLLKPPVNINAHLVRKEIPLFLTSQQDQNRLSAIQGADKTLVRLTFDYHSEHERFVYKVEDMYASLTDSQIENNTSIYPDDRETYANEIEIYFRNTIPQSVSGKVNGISDDNSNSLISAITTGSYQMGSISETLVPNLPAGIAQNYIGGLFILEEQQFIIQDILPSATAPVIRVLKKELDPHFSTNESGLEGNLLSPRQTQSNLFTVVENMQNTSCWGNGNPHTLRVKIGTTPQWAIKRKVFYQENPDEGITERYIEKSRGFWNNASITAIQEVVSQDGDNVVSGYKGLYKITLTNFHLPTHSQYNAHGVSVEWWNGEVRLRRKSAYLPNNRIGEQSVFEVIRMEDSSLGLVLYIQDPLFDGINSDDAIYTNSAQEVNYYPGYKVYLYATPGGNLTESNLLPLQDEEVRYSIFGLRSLGNSYHSKMSSPALLFAQELSEPKQPEQPQGPSYATRPDFFGKATYSFTTQFEHKPNSILFYRSNDEALLNALYKKSTMENIRLALEPIGGNDEEYLSERWHNFLDFEVLKSEGNYRAYPPQEESYRLPLPDNTNFIQAINDFIAWHNGEYGHNIPIIDRITSLSQIIIPVSAVNSEIKITDFMREAILNSFVPLTEFPIVYQHIKPNVFFPQDYNPMPKKQHIRDRNGHILPPTDPDFDMAPMAKVLSANPHRVLFTDFTLDGTSKNIYFYCVREMNLQMQMGSFSSFTPPVKMVNTNPPECPEIKRIMPVLENQVLEIAPHIQFEINAYHPKQYIRKMVVYRAFSMLDAQSIRTMDKVHEFDIEAEGMLDDSTWTIKDDFNDLAEVPYGDPLFYRITALRKVEYSENEETIIEYAPSKPSKITASLIVESVAPNSPVLSYTSDVVDDNGNLNNVILQWNKTAYKGKYHIYMMNSQGNWMKIAEKRSNEETIFLPLADTDLNLGSLQTRNEDGDALYHHFKAIAENSAGMFSIEEYILTIGI